MSVQDGRYVATKSALARRLGISYYTLVSSYWKRAGRPIDHSTGSAKYDVEAYRDWIATFRTAHNIGSVQPYEWNERERGLIEKNRIAAAREKFKLEVEMGEYVPRISVNKTIDTGNAIVRREMEKAFGSELPPRLEGLKAGEIRRILMSRLVEIYQHLPGQLIGNGANGH